MKTKAQSVSEIENTFKATVKKLNPKIDFNKNLKSQLDSLTVVELTEQLENELEIEIGSRDFQMGYLETLEKTVTQLAKAAGLS